MGGQRRASARPRRKRAGRGSGRLTTAPTASMAGQRWTGDLMGRSAHQTANARRPSRRTASSASSDGRAEQGCGGKTPPPAPAPARGGGEGEGEGAELGGQHSRGPRAPDSSAARGGRTQKQEQRAGNWEVADGQAGRLAADGGVLWARARGAGGPVRNAAGRRGTQREMAVRTIAGVTSGTSPLAGRP